VFDVGHGQADRLSFAAEAGELRYYFMAAPKLTDVLETYTALTGRMSLPPLWALGYHQARWSYPDEATVRALAAEFRQRRIPCDALYLDIDYMDGFRCFTWNRQAFPTHRQMLADLRGAGFKTVAIIDAGIKMDAGYHVHDDGLARGAFLTYPDGTLFHGPVWPGDCYFPDFTDPAVRAWWGGLYAPLVEDGIAGFWNDMNEPSIFRQQTMPGVLRHECDGHAASHREIHNAYGTQMARATADGLAQLRPDERHLVISRAAFAGHQRHAMVWTGDNYSTWESLRLTIPMGLSLGLSGLAFNGADVGGFMGDCTGELLARWTQLGAFTPFFRNHAAMSSVQQEPWAFGPEIEVICKRAIELRYELLPALVTAFWECSQTGLPIMRPLVLAYQSDPRCATLDDQFLLGSDLLVAPVLEPGVSGRRVYLPAGAWFDFWTGARHAGGRDVWAEAPLERIPLFVKAGSVLPMQPVIQHTGEPVPDTLILRVFPGIGESVLYEDDGRSLAYRTGASRVTRFALRGDATWLDVVVSTEGAYASPRMRFRWEVAGLAGPPGILEVDGQESDVWRWDAAANVLVVETGPCRRLALQGLVS
jgi:alpha-glucosidase